MSELEKTDGKKVIDTFKMSEGGRKAISFLKWTPAQKLAAVLGPVLLGTSAFVAYDVLASNRNTEAPSSDTDENTTPSDSTGVSQITLSTGSEHAVEGGTITPGANVNISSSCVTDNMSFEEAFNEARAECGPGSIFEWKGNVYNTYYREEWLQLSKEDKQEFLQNVGFKPSTPSHGEGSEEPEPEIPKLGDYRITEHQGWEFVSHDENGDGVVDFVVLRNPETGEWRMTTDESGDGTLDTVHVLDPITRHCISEAPIEPITVTMEEIDSSDVMGELVESGVYDINAVNTNLFPYQPEEVVAIIDEYPEEDIEMPVDTVTNEIVYDEDPVDDEDFDNDLDII